LCTDTLHVLGPSSIDLAIFFNRCKGIGVPVFFHRRDDVVVTVEDDARQFRLRAQQCCNENGFIGHGFTNFGAKADGFALHVQPLNTVSVRTGGGPFGGDRTELKQCFEEIGAFGGV
jgi:hypothetical protein